jgi:hypothetical protein
MLPDKIATIVASIVTVALVTTVLMRGSAAAQVIGALGNAFSGALRAAQGR